MQIISSIQEMQSFADALRSKGKRIGFVPTMGYLHDGHLSLIRIAKQKSDLVITSIFVNPTQFAPHEDFERYPRNIERDTSLAESAGTDILFLPLKEEIYPNDYLTFVELDKITGVLEGKIRPTHFRGVATIVAKLFNITKPHIAVFGQKDAQQAVIIQKMANDLNFGIEIIIAPIVREQDGLAMSSRNVYLSTQERSDAPVLYSSLKIAQEMIQNGEYSPNVILETMKKLIASKPSASIDYVSITNATTLQDISALQKKDQVLISLAVRFGSTRLIDNIILTV
jgi:pantoate--beta-alanine ligase